MKGIKKLLALVLSVALISSAITAGTIAYLTSSDEDVNVMTLGNVEIAQHEFERVVDKDGNYTTIDVAGVKSYELKEFTQNKPLYPVVGDVMGGYDSTEVRLAQLGHNSRGGMVVLPVKNIQDKFVVVENTGKSDAYVRTIVGFEAGSVVEENYYKLVGYSSHFTWNETQDWFVTEVDGNNYYFVEFVYNGYEDVQHPNGVLTPGDYTYNSLAQVYLFNEAKNEDMEALDGNKNGTFDILVLSQAVQTAGFENAKQALDTGFGAFNETNVKVWFEGIEFPDFDKVKEDDSVIYNGEIYPTLPEAVAKANANGGGVITLNGNTSLDSSLEISSDITINGNGYEIGRVDNETKASYVGNLITVKPGATFTLEDIKVDGGADWTGATDATLGRGTKNDGITSTGALIQAETNASIILNDGAVLRNNDGANAVHLGTRIGATLTLNGGEIINNNSGAGAIWGGGQITVNSGKINYNSSTGPAGAIRMVSNCNFTMNGGEMSNNKAATTGGAIYGYGASTYNLNGGKIENNVATTAGVIYTGDSSTVNLAGTEVLNNKADEVGAFRLSNYTKFVMTGGKLSGNENNNPNWDGFYGWNPAVNISGGALEDDVTIQGGLTPTVGGNGITGVVHFSLGTNHNTANLAKDFGTIKFTVAEGTNFAAFNLKPAADYVYTAGDEAKLVCLNEGYETYWTGLVFKLQAK